MFYKLQTQQIRFSLLFVLFAFLANNVNAQFSPIWHAADQRTASGSGQVVNVLRPNNLAVGNLIIVMYSTQMSDPGASSSFSTPAGFNLIRFEQDPNSSERPEIVAFYKIADGTEPAFISNTVNDNGLTPQWKAISFRVTHFDPNNPIGNISSINSDINTVNSLSLSGINTTNNNSMVVAALNVRKSVANPQIPSGMTSRWGANGVGGTDDNSNSPAMYVASQNIATAGATGNKEFTWNTNGRAAGLMFVVNSEPIVSDLEVNISSSNMNPDPGNPANIVLTITATNNGPNDATGVNLNIPLNSGYSFAGQSASIGSYNPALGTWTIGSLASGNSETLDLTVYVRCSGNYSQRSQINGLQFDIDTLNNRDTVFVTPLPPSPTCGLTAVNDTMSTIQGQPVTLNLITNDLGNLTGPVITITSPPIGGFIQILSGGEVTYIPNGNFSGNDNFTYQVCNNLGDCDNAQVGVFVEENFVDACFEANRSKIYYLPFPENVEIARKIFFSSANTAGSITDETRSVTSIKIPYPGTVLVYDHWEDGYEADATIRTQTTTQIWGDGDLTNGVAPGYPNDILPAGASIVLDNTFQYNPRVQSTIVYDGRDRIFSSADISVSKVTGDAGSRFPLQNLKADIYDISRYGRAFILPAGENVNTGGLVAFRYCAIIVTASENNTLVQLDYDGNGTVDTSATINAGETFFYDGTGSLPNGVVGDVNQANDLKSGGIVTADKPVGVDFIYGGIENYSLRNNFLLPGNFNSDEYYNPVHSTNASAPVALVFYNRLGNSITIDWENGVPNSGSFVIPANDFFLFTQANAATGYNFKSQGGQSFTALAVIDADNNGSSYDWAFTPISAERLTNYTSVAWAPGSTTNAPGDNYNPIWVTPTANTTVYVKYDGNLSDTLPLISSCGLPYDTSFNINRLNVQLIFNPGGDQSGMALYTCDTVGFSAVWGQRPFNQAPSNTPVGAPALDAGYVLQPKCLDFLVIANDDREVTEPEISVVVNVVTNDNAFLTFISPASVATPLDLLQPSNGTIQTNGDGTITYTPNIGFIGTDFFEYRVCTAPYPNVCDVAMVRIDVTNCAAALDENLITGRVFLEQVPDNGAFNGEDFVGGVKVDLYSDNNCDGIVNGPDVLLTSTFANLSGFYSFSTGGSTYSRDNFDGAGNPPASTGASGNDGTVNWANNWTEIGPQATNFGASPVTIALDPNVNNNSLILNGDNRGAVRSINIPATATGASVKFDYRRRSLNAQGEAMSCVVNRGTPQEIILTVIDDGGALGTDIFYTSVSFNVPLANLILGSPNTLTFITNGNTATDDFFHVDNVEFIYFPACFRVQVDATNTNGRFVASSLNFQTAQTNELGTCATGNFLGVLANIDAVNDTRSILQDQPAIINVLQNDIGIPNPTTVSTTALLQPANGSTVINPNGSITYIPNPGFLGADQFEYRVCSMDDPGVCDVATVTVNVGCFADAVTNVVSGLVFNDYNENGSYNNGERGAQGFNVELYHDLNNNSVLDLGDTLMQTQASDANGAYVFNVVTGATVRDEFNTNGSPSGNNGTANWVNNWTNQVGTTLNTSTTNIQNNRLEIRNRNRGARRSANLTGATAASLTFDYQGVDIAANANRQVFVQVANSVAGPWTTLFTLNDNTSGTETVTIPPVNIGSTTSVRFITRDHGQMEDNGRGANFDNIQIFYHNANRNYIVQLDKPIPSGYEETTLPQDFYPISFTLPSQANCAANFGIINRQLTVPDINATFVNRLVTGDVSVNDNVQVGSSYGLTPVLTSSPTGSNPIINMNADGTYDFTSDIAGIYEYNVEVCAPAQLTPCPIELLTIFVNDSRSISNVPIANTDYGVTFQNTPITLRTLANDLTGNMATPLNPASVTVTSPPDPINVGSVSVNPITGDITFTPVPSFFGKTSYTYEVCDVGTPPNCTQALQIIDVTSSAIPNNVIAIDDYAYTYSSQPVNGNLITNDIDPQGNNIAATPQNVSLPGIGSFVLLADGSYTFTPVLGYVGPVNFPYQICDDGIPVACAEATLYILVGNQTSHPDINATFVNLEIQGSVATNDKVVAGSTYGNPAIQSQPLGSNPQLTLLPDGSYSFEADIAGVYIYDVEICRPDQLPPCNTELLTIYVKDRDILNNIPFANTDIAITPFNTSVTLNTLENDGTGTRGRILVPSTVAIIPATAPNPITEGSLSVNATTGAITFTPVNGFVGQVTYEYEVCDDGVTPQCAAATQIITVLPDGAQNTILAADDFKSLYKNQIGTGNVLTNDIDPEGDNMTVTPLNITRPGIGNLVLNADGSYTFTPTPGFVGQTSFVYRVCDDGIPQSCTNATLYILVEDDLESAPDFHVTVVDQIIYGDVSTNDQIPVGMIYSNPTPLPGNPANDTLNLNGDGTYDFNTPNPGIYRYVVDICTPAPNPICIEELLTITVFDPYDTSNVPITNLDRGVVNGHPTTPSTIELNVRANDTVGNVRFGPTGTLSVPTLPSPTTSNGGTIIINANGNAEYTPAPGYYGNDTFIYNVCEIPDGSLCLDEVVYITVLEPDNLPMIIASDDFNMVFQGDDAVRTVDFGIVVNDHSNAVGNLTVSTAVGNQPGVGVLTLAPDGSYSFTPDPAFIGTAVFPYTITNGSISAMATLYILVMDIQVLPVNFKDLNANCTQNTITINWTTTSEENNSHFELLKKGDDNDWYSIGTIMGNGTKYSETQYAYYDNLKSNHNIIHVYKLQQFDFDGNSHFSNPIVAVCEENPVQNSYLSIYPNPVSDKVNISNSTSIGKVIISNVNGLTVMEVNTSEKQTIVDISTLASGVYFIKVNDTIQKLIKY